MSAVYLIRHGVTLANKENRFAGRSDEPLHLDGEKHVRKMGSKLKELGIQRIYAGPLRRTRQSAEIVAEVCGTDYGIENGLNDIMLPHWDGLTKDEIRQRFGSQYPDWLACPQGFQVPGCETLKDVQQRAVRAVERIRALNAGRNVLLVTHLIVARCLILHDTGNPLKEFRSVKVDNGEVVRLCRYHGAQLSG